MRVEDLSYWRSFIAVSSKGNFTKAAKSLGVGTPLLSKRISKLEEQLGIRLFQRSTRVVSLTSEGKSLLPRVESILKDLEGLENQFHLNEKLKGTIKLTCPPFIAHQILLPILNDFMAQHPEVDIDLDLSKSFKNLIEDGIDMAIRIEKPKDSELIYRKIGPNKLVLCASKQYLKKYSKIKKPEDLINHKMLVMSIHDKCKFKNYNYSLGRLKNNKNIRCNDGSFLTNMALNHSGVLVRSVYDVEKYLESGKLVELLNEFPLEIFGDIYAVIPSRRYLAPRVRSLLDKILGEFPKFD